jgi:hypothetical protein
MQFSANIMYPMGWKELVKKVAQEAESPDNKGGSTVSA